jgi:hypothetical protein
LGYSKVENQSMGVSICLDVVLIETLDLDTEKSQSQISRQFQKVSLDDQDISIEIEKF